MGNVKKERLDYFDTTKGFAILLVILGHICGKGEIRTWLYSFHMPIFFIISGCLSRYTPKKKLKEFLRLKIKSLLVPYFIFSFLYAFVMLLVYGGINAFFWDAIYIFTLYGVGPAWFLPALFIAEVIFYVLSKIIRNNKILLMSSILIFLLAYYIANIDYNLVIFVLDRSLFALAFFIIGYCSFNIINAIDLHPLIIVLFIIVNAFFAHINGNVDLWSLRFNNIYLYIICSLIGSISSILLFKKVKSKELIYFGRNSLIIMAVHNIIIIVLKEVFNLDFSSYFIVGVVFIATIIIQIPIINFINNYIPWALGKSNVDNRLQTDR